VRHLQECLYIANDLRDVTKVQLRVAEGRNVNDARVQIALKDGDDALKRWGLCFPGYIVPKDLQGEAPLGD